MSGQYSERIDTTRRERARERDSMTITPADVTQARLAHSAAGRAEELERFNVLAERAARGELPGLDEVQALTHATDRTVRGQAKRLLAHVLLQQARHSAATLMVDACEEFDYCEPVTLREATQHVQGMGQPQALIALCMRAAERLGDHEQIVPALVALQNALVTDAANGSVHVNDPKFVRRLMAAYERLAEPALRSAGVQPARRGRRRSPSGGKYRMAHVVAQLVDGGHAPSRSIETTLRLADRERFETFLCVTDSLSPHAEQPPPLLASHTSDRRAPQRIRKFQEEFGVPVLLPRDRRTFVAAAADLHRQMAERQIDIACFHGSAATPTEWLMCAWQAAPWQADAGYGIPLHCPAVDFQFFEFEETMEALAFWCRERGVAYGLKKAGADMSHVESATALTREELRIPTDHVILGTVGNHLPKRLSPRFCMTVAQVLRECPRTTFIAVGPGDFAGQVKIFGADLCSARQGLPRVRFAGHQAEPERMTKAFDIYLNSYPDGGGFVLGDAMAAGKPVVAMVAGDSSYAQAARAWLGEECLVTPVTDTAYAARVKELIADPAEREAFGKRMRKLYEERHDARRGVEHMSARIMEQIEKET